MTHYKLNLLAIEPDQEVISNINNQLKNFNFDIKLYSASDLANALDIIKTVDLAYIFVSNNALKVENIKNITKNLSSNNNKDCIIVITDRPNTNILSKVDDGNFLMPSELSRDFFNKLISYAVINKNSNNNISNLDDLYQADFLATHDQLTLLPNRFYLLKKLPFFIETNRLERRPLAMFFLDLDNFKDVNDKAGHAAGDLVLQEVARRLVKNTRITDLAGRLGGDEFIVVLPHIRDKSDTEIVANKLLSVLNEPIYINNESWQISCSIGVSIFPDDGSTAESLLENADTAMYEAKRIGKNKVQYFDKKLNEKVTRKYKLINELHNAIQNNQFNALLQPQIHITNNQLFGAELFIRWHHPEKGLIMPNDFLPDIADTGYISAIGDFMLTKSFNIKNNLLKNKSCKLAINVEPRQLASNDFVNYLHEISQKTAFENILNNLAIEITESSFKVNFKNIKSRLEAIRNLGITVTLDDFGSGDSSISKLMELPIDIIKIDYKYFTATKSDNKYLAGIIALAHSMGIRVMAKRVDNKEGLTSLAQLNCDYAQGYYFSKLLTEEEFSEFIRKNTGLLKK